MDVECHGCHDAQVLGVEVAWHAASASQACFFPCLPASVSAVDMEMTWEVAVTSKPPSCQRADPACLSATHRKDNSRGDSRAYGRQAPGSGAEWQCDVKALSEQRTSHCTAIRKTVNLDPRQCRLLQGLLPAWRNWLLVCALQESVERSKFRKHSQLLLLLVNDMLGKPPPPANLQVETLQLLRELDGALMQLGFSKLFRERMRRGQELEYTTGIRSMARRLILQLLEAQFAQ